MERPEDLLQCGLSPEAIESCEGQPSEAALDACPQETNTTAEDLPSIYAPSGSTATLTAADRIAKVATTVMPTPGCSHDCTLLG